MSAYEILTDVEHVLKRSDMYVGSVENDEQEAWILEGVVVMKKRIQFPPALLKISDEILCNAVDQHIRGRGTGKIKVIVNDSCISVENDGDSIPFDNIDDLPTPTVLFGCLRSGENFDDTSARVTGGKNGYGCKLTNIFSSEFSIDIVNNGRRFRQKWTNNMETRHQHIISVSGKKKNYVRVTFRPDFVRFGVENMSTDVQALIKKRALDAIFCFPTLQVYINGKQIFKTQMDYIKSVRPLPHVDSKLVLSKGKDWSVVVFKNASGEFQHMSFANGIATSRGGTHVTHVLKRVTKIISTALIKLKLKPSATVIKQHLFLLIRTDVVNPVFESQCKTLLATKRSKFKSQWIPDSKFTKSLIKSSLFFHLVDIFSKKLEQKLQNLDGKKTVKCRVPKLIDAKFAGTAKSEYCTLVLAEGDSALSMLLKGVTGNRLQKTIGLFPLRGKLLNCAEAAPSKLMANTEIQHVKKILGLSNGKRYHDTKKLRYGHVLVAADSDEDGQHILGLVLTMFRSLYPNLIELGYVQTFVSPLLIAKKGKKLVEFFKLSEFQTWQKRTSNPKSYAVKFLKGLGSSTNADAKRYFGNLKRYVRLLKKPKDGLKSLEMVFSKDMMTQRKRYVCQPSHSYEEGTLEGFVKGPLHEYARSSLTRAIPSIDGFKESTRKILWTCLYKQLFGEKKDIKVVELAGIVSKFSKYHHGESSLQGAIVTLARRYTTVNNVPLLVDSGQFGSYHAAGSDSASARYIFTRLEDTCKYMFNMADLDILPRTTVDGELAEPVLLAPLLPIVLLNGATGIATGFSTNIFPHDPNDLIVATLAILNDTVPSILSPSFRNWDGIIASYDGGFSSTGKSTRMDENTIHIHSLPIGVFPSSFEKILNKLCEKNIVKSFDFEHFENGPHVIVKFVTKTSTRDMQKHLGLVRNHSTRNMHLLNTNGVLTKYASVAHILKEYITFKLSITVKRIAFQIDTIKRLLAELDAILIFIRLFLQGEIVFQGKNDTEIFTQLSRHGIQTFHDKLMSLSIRRLTSGEIEKTLANRHSLSSRLDALLATNAVETYTAELQAYQATLRNRSKRKHNFAHNKLNKRVKKQ